VTGKPKKFLVFFTNRSFKFCCPALPSNYHLACFALIFFVIKQACLFSRGQNTIRRSVGQGASRNLPLSAVVKMLFTHMWPHSM
jgi:hypothetical protein